jgi:hypothetical protein
MINLERDFVIDRASVIGRLHTEKFVNNQDGHHLVYTDEFIIGVVSDGCSASPHSEVGAYLVPRLVTNAILDRMSLLVDRVATTSTATLIEETMEDVRMDVASYLRSFASHLGESMYIMQDSLLATAVGFVVTKQIAWVFSIGDGKTYLNGEELDLDNEHAQYPDMVVYGAMNPVLLRQPAKRFTVSPIISTDSIKSLAISTDGIEHFILAEGQEYPGQKELIPNISELWKVGAEVGPIFKRMAKTVYRSEYDKGLDIVTQKVFRSPLLDDTTIIILKRI